MQDKHQCGFADDVVADFLRRSYAAVDGLWFVKIEEADGFARALELDEQVWRIMPKIQARKGRELLGVEGNEAEGLARCFGLKLHADGHEYDISIGPDGVRARVYHCCWLAAMRKSGRGDLAAAIGERVCTAEGQMWCQEFGGEYQFSLPCRRCDDGEYCEYVFTRTVGERHEEESDDSSSGD